MKTFSLEPPKKGEVIFVIPPTLMAFEATFMGVLGKLYCFRRHGSKIHLEAAGEFDLWTPNPVDKNAP